MEGDQMKKAVAGSGGSVEIGKHPLSGRPTMSTRTPLARRVIAALLLVLLTACHSWRPTTVSPQQLIPEEQPSPVRFTLTNGETVTIKDPTMRNDSIVGVTDADGALRTSAVGVALRDVRLLEVRHFSVAKTIILAVPFIGLAVWVVAAANYFIHYEPEVRP